MIIFFNYKTLENHIGFDSSWAYLKAALMWNEKSISSNLWADQTNAFLDSSMPLASLLFGLTGNLLFSYGFANLLVLILVLLCLNSIFVYIGIKNNVAKLIAFYRRPN